MAQPDVSTPARKAAVGIENRIRNDALESGALIAPSGQVIVFRKGHNNHVTLTVSELTQAAGATFTHNHPGGSGPSLSDVSIASQYAFKELRVVTATHRYRVDLFSANHRFRLLRLFPIEQGRALRACTDDVRKGLVHPKDFGSEALHRTWGRVSFSLGFFYWREQS